MTRRSLVALLLSFEPPPPGGPREPRKLRGGFVFTEGPVCSREGDLFFSDVGAERIYRLSKAGLATFRNSSNLANGLAFDSQGRLLVCERGRLTRTEPDGRLTILADSYGGKGLHWPNDLAVRFDGSIFFTDLKQRTEWANPAKTGFNAVYQLSPDGKLSIFSRECGEPNGIALSPKEDLLYVADTLEGNVRVYELEAGRAPAGRVFASLNTPKSAAPDGLKTDPSGRVWVCAEDGIWIFSRQGGHVATLRIPERPSNCAFSRDYRALFVTARTSVYQLQVADLAG